jgi:hypothetical protein
MLMLEEGHQTKPEQSAEEKAVELTTKAVVYSDEIATDSETKWHSIRANRHSEESERSDAGILYIA